MSGRVYELVTERMIAALEAGTVPWRQPWRPGRRPRSMSTGQPYRRVNTYLLKLAAADAGYASPFWGSYRQIGELGGQVRKGEHSTLVVFFRQYQVADRDCRADPDPGLAGEDKTGTVPVLRYFRVFNAAQADGLPARYHPGPESGESGEIRRPQQVLDAYLAGGGPRLRHVNGDRAFYRAADDTITLPERSQFDSPGAYYGTAFHEAGHSTGHKERLDRPGVAAFDHFGSQRYAKEELVAEMAASMLCAHTGIDDGQAFGRSAAYVAGWLRALRDDKRLVVSAAAQAEKACDLILTLARAPADGDAAGLAAARRPLAAIAPPARGPAGDVFPAAGPEGIGL